MDMEISMSIVIVRWLKRSLYVEINKADQVMRLLLMLTTGGLQSRCRNITKTNRRPADGQRTQSQCQCNILLFKKFEIMLFVLRASTGGGVPRSPG